LVPVLALAAAAGCGGSIGGDEEEETLTIGSVVPLSGTAAAYGEAYKRSADLAIEEINEAGGVQGRQVELVIEDDGSDPAQGVAAVRRLIQREGVNVIFGGTYTPPTLAEFNAAIKSNVIFWSPGSSAPELTEPFQRLVFQANLTLDDSALPVAQLVASMEPDSVGFVQQTDAYGDLTHENFVRFAEEEGLEPPAVVESMAGDASSAVAQVSALKEADVDVVVLGVTAGPIAAVLKEAYAQGMNIPFVAFGGGAAPAIDQLVSSEAPLDYYAVTPLACTLQDECASEFVEKFKDAFPDVEPLVYDAQGYVATKVFLEGLQQADDLTDIDSMISAWEDLEPYESELLPYPIDFTEDDHRGTRNSFLYGYRDGELSFFGNDLNENVYEGSQ
jgi:branched-chain amino acid transport system substrate-binding protein